MTEVTDITDNAAEALSAADEAYDSADSGSIEGPWPDDGNYQVLFKGFRMWDTVFSFAPATGGELEREPGLAVQPWYQHVEGDEDSTFRDTIVQIPTEASVYGRLHPDRGRNCQLGVSIGLAHIKTINETVLGRPASTSMLADIKETNALIEAGELVGLMIAIRSKPWKSGKGTNHNVYINGRFTVSATAETQDTTGG